MVGSFFALTTTRSLTIFFAKSSESAFDGEGSITA